MSDEARNGFTLLEMVCVMAIIAMLTAVALPFVPRSTSRPRLEAYALQLASLLTADRNAAIRRQTEVATSVNASTHLVRSGATRDVVLFPDDVHVDALLPRTCHQHQASSTISFFPNGTSCGGAIALARLDTRYEVRVNWLTGRIEVASRDNSK